MLHRHFGNLPVWFFTLAGTFLLLQTTTPTKRPSSPVMRARAADVDKLDVVNVVTQAEAKHFAPAHSTSPRPTSILKSRPVAQVTPSPKAEGVRAIVYLHLELFP